MRLRSHSLNSALRMFHRLIAPLSKSRMRPICIVVSLRLLRTKLRGKQNLRRRKRAKKRPSLPRKQKRGSRRAHFGLRDARACLHWDLRGLFWALLQSVG